MWHRLLTRLAIVLLGMAFFGGTLSPLASAASAQSHPMTCGGEQGTAARHALAGDCGGVTHHPPIACPQALCAAAPTASIPGAGPGATVREPRPTLYPDFASRLNGRTVAPDLVPPINLA